MMLDLTACNVLYDHGPEVIKLFFILNLDEHEINLFINVKMPTIVDILTLISRINTTSE